MATPYRIAYLCLPALRYAKSWMEWLSSSWQAEALSSGWCGNRQAATGVSLEQLRTVADLAFSFPPDFAVHPDLESMLTTRREQVEQGERIDWGCAEALAFGCTLAEGTHVRLTGQDSERGTFNQRHAVLHDQVRSPETPTQLQWLTCIRGTVQTDGSEFTPLAAVNPYSVLGLKPAPQREVRYDQLFKVYNSSLSEAAVLGFEYGMSRFEGCVACWYANPNVCIHSWQATRCATPTHWSCGKRSLVTLPTTRRESSIRISRRAKTGGNSARI